METLVQNQHVIFRADENRAYLLSGYGQTQLAENAGSHYAHTNNSDHDTDTMFILSEPFSPERMNRVYIIEGGK